MSRVLVARNSAMLTVAQVVARLGGLAVFMALTRLLTVGDVGLFSYAITLASFLALAVDFGLDPVVTRETARGEGEKGAGLALAFKAALFGVAYPVLLIAAVGLTGTGRSLAAIALLGGAVLHESASRTVGAWFLARGRAEYMLASDALAAALRLVFVFAVLAAGATLVGVAAAYVAASAATAAGLGAWAWRHGFRPTFTAPPAERWRLFRDAAAFAVYGLLFQLYFRIDLVLLASLRPAADAGQYAAAFRVIEVMLVIPAALTGALFPVLARLDGDGDRAGFARACREGTRGLATIAFGSALAVGVAAPFVVRVIAGAGYADAVGYLRLLLPTYVLVCLAGVGLLAVNAVGRQRLNVGIMLVAALAKIAWNLAFIRTGGVTAVCWGSALASLLTAGCALAVARPWYPVTGHLAAAAKSAAAAAVGVAAAWLLRWQPWFVQAVLACGIFGVVAAATGAIGRADLAVIVATLRRQVPGAEVAER